ncbi:MAG: TetR/AcrR family transcriptional regulator [bacterium]|nr:TetR/AcrR family transcriptional regulator [bacterium]
MNTPVVTPPDTNAVTRTQRRSADMRRTLIEVAETLLIEGGASAVTAEEVARLADVSLQTVYNRVGGKPALLLAIAERAMEENRQYIDEAYDGGGNAEERGWRIFHAYVRFALERPHQFRILANPPEAPEAIARMAVMAQEQNARLASIIRDGIAENRVNPALDPDSTANALWAMLNGLLCLALRNDALRPGTVSPEALVQAALMMIQFGLRVREED